jgi:hypothetical protein
MSMVDWHHFRHDRCPQLLALFGRSGPAQTTIHQLAPRGSNLTLMSSGTRSPSHLLQPLVLAIGYPPSVAKQHFAVSA